MKHILSKIAGCLVNINIEDLMPAEKKIAKILVKEGFLKLDKSDSIEEYVAIEAKEQMEDLQVIIEVGGDHGDGNVALVKKSKGVSVIIKDFDNAELPEESEQDDEPIPETREWEANVKV